jgi:hypothetical protein
LRKESDPRLRYYMFKRLNTGGENLSDQEIRNCTIRLLNGRFNDFIGELSHNSDFVQTISNLSDEKRDQKYDEELVLRFFAFHNYRQRYVHDVGDFMTEYMEKVSAGELPFEYEAERKRFAKTFALLRATLDANAFAGVNERGTFISKFLIYHYEAVALGVQPFLHYFDSPSEQLIERLRNALSDVKKSEHFQRITKGGGKNRPAALTERIGAVQHAIGALFE